MIELTVLLRLSTVLLMLVPTLVFGGSALVWKIRGGTNVTTWAAYDGVAAFIVTSIMVLTAAPSFIWPGQAAYRAIGLVPLLYSAVLWRHYGNGRQRMEKVIAYFLELRAARADAKATKPV